MPKPIVISDEVAARCDGPDQFERTKAAMRHMLSVPRAEILRREAEYNLQKALRPVKRGPKKKAVLFVPGPNPGPDPIAQPS